MRKIGLNGFILEKSYFYSTFVFICVCSLFSKIKKRTDYARIEKQSQNIVQYVPRDQQTHEFNENNLILLFGVVIAHFQENTFLYFFV